MHDGTDGTGIGTLTMQWDLIGTWVALAISILTGVFKMGQLVKTIEAQQAQLDEIKKDVDKNKDIPVELATLKTDVKYLIQGIARIEQHLIHKKVE
jgi:hypothetical protein